VDLEGVTFDLRLHLRPVTGFSAAWISSTSTQFVGYFPVYQAVQ